MQEQDAERIALDIFKAANTAGERITLGTVERRLAELLSHPPGHCPLCAAAAEITVQRVFWIAASFGRAAGDALAGCSVAGAAHNNKTVRAMQPAR